MDESRAERLLAAAEEVRAVAKGMAYPETKRQMLVMADAYERRAAYYLPDPEGEDSLYSGLSDHRAKASGRPAKSHH